MGLRTKKIVNDPVYGFITIPEGIIYQLMEHRYFQRLRRIKQLGLTHYVYPGALHTRFHHALGALHLMTETIAVLRSKDLEISDEEATGALIAIFLHDIGHGPFSHALEYKLVNVEHEALSLLFMERLNKEFNGALTTAIAIFKNEYKKRFLYQLITGQLDMDRMDYLSRDSFFTGVHEGVIGYDRIIKMLNVKNDQLVVEEKGLYSIEKFLVARKLMYWQVFLHKTVLSAEIMLVKIFERSRQLVRSGWDGPIPLKVRYFLEKDWTLENFKTDEDLLEQYADLDDIDVFGMIKGLCESDDFVLSFLSKGLVQRRLLKTEIKNEPFSSDQIEELRHKVGKRLNIPVELTELLVFTGSEANRAYNTLKEEIFILQKSGEIQPMSAIDELGLNSRIITKFYLCYPRNI